jgi:3-phenylpropionate/cinnamic acid dioxygenase small subunit
MRMTEWPDEVLTELRRLADIEAIKQLRYRYMRLMDANCFAEWGETLAEDCYMYSPYLGAAEGRDQAVAALSRSYEKTQGKARTNHHVHMPEITIESADRAHAIWSIDDYSTWFENGEEKVEWGRGWYDEAYIRTKDGWRISKCILSREAVRGPTG